MNYDIPVNMLLCHLPDCNMGNDGNRALAMRLCPYCRQVGYCCKDCMTRDMERHLMYECPKNDMCRYQCPRCNKCLS